MLPAYAGMIPRRRLAGDDDPGAPRVCGDDPARLTTSPVREGVLPAYAGMIRTYRPSAIKSLSAPRVCGDDPGQVQSDLLARLCSPRMRG